MTPSTAYNVWTASTEDKDAMDM